MNKNLKIGLILGSTALVLGTVIYFATRKTDEAATEGGEEKSGDEKSDTSEEKKTSENKTKSSRPKQKPTASKGGTASKPAPAAVIPTPKEPLPKKVTANTSLRGFNVATVLSKVENPLMIKGKLVASAVNDTKLMGAKGVTLYTLKNKGTTIGKIVKSTLTESGNYLVDVVMSNGKTVTVNGGFLVIA